MPRPALRLARALAVPALAVAAAFPVAGSAGCGGAASTRCQVEEWVGECELVGVYKVREAEFPAPHVVMETTWRAIPNDRSPGFTPPDARDEQEMTAFHESDYVAHVERFGRVRCELVPPPAGVCEPARLRVATPAFSPKIGGGAATQARGCARLEASGPDAPSAEERTSSVVGPRLLFQADSSTLDEAAQRGVAEMAKLLAADPAIECITVVGQITGAETPTLAHERARAAYLALVAAGVGEERAMTMASSERVAGAGGRAPDAVPADRRVEFRVVLRRAPAPAR